MKKIAMLPRILIVFSAIALISGCAGGRGGSSAPNTTIFQARTAGVKLLTNGTLSSGTLIGGIDITLTLPAGVSVKSTTPPQTDAGVVTASGMAGGSLGIGVYTAATSTLPGKVRVALVNAAGFGTGEFAIVNCDIASGSTPAATGFSLGNFSAINVGGAAISGLTPGFTADIR
jgi:hypothetical protein